jgi:sulfur-carrier protein
MGVRVRFFAAVREAAGMAETEVDPAPLRDLLARLRDELGEEFGRRLAISSVLVDGSTWDHDDERMVAAGSEIAILPPVSGGGHARDPN